MLALSIMRMRMHELPREASPSPRPPKNEDQPRRHGLSAFPSSQLKHTSNCAFATTSMPALPSRPRQAWPETTSRPSRARTATLRPPSRSIILTFLLALTLLSAPAAAVQLAAFDNCLPNTYRDRDPPPLQWVPLYVDAVFDTESKSHALTVTTWGNITGSYDTVELPAADSPEWSNIDYTHGKIQQEPEPNMASRRATTLVSKINVLTYEPYNTKVDFCKDGLINGTCPLPPIFDTTQL